LSALSAFADEAAHERRATQAQLSVTHIRLGNNDAYPQIDLSCIFDDYHASDLI